MNIDSTPFSKIMGRSAASQNITSAGLENAALPTSSTGGQSFHEILKQINALPTGSLNKAKLSESSSPRLGESPSDFLNRAKLPPAPSGDNSTFSINSATLPASSTPLSGESFFSLNTAPLPTPTTPLPGSPGFSLNTADLPAPTTPPVNTSLKEPTAAEAETRHQQIEKAAEGLVSNALILPMLKQLRHSSLGENTIFSGGNGEKTFGPEFDMELSDRIAKSPRLGVKNALVARLEGKKATPKTAAANSETSSTPRIDLNA